MSRLAYVKMNVYNSTIWSCSTSPGDKSNLASRLGNPATRFLHKGELRKHSGRRNHQRRPRKLFCLLAELMIPRKADLLRKPSVKLSHYSNWPLGNWPLGNWPLGNWPLLNPNRYLNWSLIEILRMDLAEWTWQNGLGSMDLAENSEQRYRETILLTS